MALLTPEQKARMLEQWRAAAAAIAEDGNTPDVFPVVKLFNPVGKRDRLLSELDPEDEISPSGSAISGSEAPNSAACGFPSWKPCAAPAGSSSSATCISVPPTKSLTAYAAEANPSAHPRLTLPPVSAGTAACP